MLRVWEFSDGRISRENVWLDTGAIIEQLSAPEPVEAADVYLRGAKTPILADGPSGRGHRPGAHGRQ